MLDPSRLWGELMEHKKYYQGEIEKIIAQDPTIIEVTRKQLTDDGYGGTTETEVTYEIICRLYNKRTVREIVTASGTNVGLSAAAAEKLLCPAAAPIEKGDTFSVDGRKYRVSLAKNYMDICKQVELEVINHASID